MRCSSSPHSPKRIIYSIVRLVDFLCTAGSCNFVICKRPYSCVIMDNLWAKCLTLPIFLSWSMFSSKSFLCVIQTSYAQLHVSQNLRAMSLDMISIAFYLLCLDVCCQLIYTGR